MGRIGTLDGVSASTEKYGLKYIKPYHRELARQIVLGASQRELCDMFHLDQSKLSLITTSPLFLIELQRLEDLRDRGIADVTTTLREVSPIALDILERTMYFTKSETLKVSIAKDLLDRAGHGAITKAVVDVHSRSETGYSDLSLPERQRLVAQRIQKMMEEKAVQEKEIEEAQNVPEVEWEEVVPEEGTPEEPVEKNSRSNGERPFGGFADCD
jgi:hypothetical protein